MKSYASFMSELVKSVTPTPNPITGRVINLFSILPTPHPAAASTRMARWSPIIDATAHKQNNEGKKGKYMNMPKTFSPYHALRK